MTQFYTRGGDDGTTGLLGKGRVAKDHPRLEAVGALDEASAVLGLARATSRSGLGRSVILAAQRHLYHIMAEVSATPENAERFRNISSEQINWMETQIEAISNQVNIPTEFIVPGDTLAGATLAQARTVVRRAERRVTSLWQHKELSNPDLLRYLNRLSSLLYILELLENQIEGQVQSTLAKASE